MFERIKQYLRNLFGSRDEDSEGITQEDSPSLETLSVKPLILCGPEYDEATKIIGSWLNDLEIPEGVKTYPAIGQDVTRETVIDLLEQTRGTRGVKIFAGHGSDDALLGPPYDGCTREVVDGREFSVVYDAAMLNRGPSALFAFCCKSAKKLGTRFMELPGRSFLGYEGNIGYDLTNEECINVWRKIIHLISKEIVEDGAITEAHEASLQSLYDDAIEYFMSGPGRNNDRNVETLIVLTKHKSFLKRFGGTT